MPRLQFSVRLQCSLGEIWLSGQNILPADSSDNEAWNPGCNATVPLVIVYITVTYLRRDTTSSGMWWPQYLPNDPKLYPSCSTNSTAELEQLVLFFRLNNWKWTRIRYPLATETHHEYFKDTFEGNAVVLEMSFQGVLFESHIERLHSGWQ